MKIAGVILLLVFSTIECRKIYKPIDKNANIDFINMEGGGSRPAAKPAVVPTAKPAVVQPAVGQPAPLPVTPAKPAVTTPKAVNPTVSPIKPVPVYPTPASKPISTPGPGTVQQLVTFYDSQGKASLIRPYSYSDAVKKGKV